MPKPRNSGAGVRSFIALDLPEEVLDCLLGLQAQLPPVARVSARDTLHLTLAFLGQQPLDRLEEVHEALDELDYPAFSMRLSGLGAFGEPVPTVLFAGVERSEALEGLHRKVRAAVERAGLKLPRERFRPHVTIARFSRGMEPGQTGRLVRFIEANAAFASPRFRPHTFSLYRSDLRPDGPRHEALASYGLR